MGLMDDIGRAAFATMPRKIETNRNITIEELYDLLLEHQDEFSMPFKLTSFLGKRITFAREPRLEMQLLVSVKDNVITVRPNVQETSFGNENFSIRTADLKNGGPFGTEFSRDDYINDVVDKITRIVNG